MPELPDIAVYIDRLGARIIGHRLEGVRLLSPFLLRTAVPPIGAVDGRTVQGVERVGKRVVIGLDGDLYLVIHLMIAGRGGAGSGDEGQGDGEAAPRRKALHGFGMRVGQARRPASRAS